MTVSTWLLELSDSFADEWLIFGEETGGVCMSTTPGYGVDVCPKRIYGVFYIWCP